MLEFLFVYLCWVIYVEKKSIQHSMLANLDIKKIFIHKFDQ